MLISSVQNQKIKDLIKLQQKSRDRKKTGLLVAEGVQENLLALQNGFEAESFFVCPDFFSDEELKQKLPENQIFEITQEIFEKIAYRKTTGGILGVYKQKLNDLQDLKHIENPLIVVLEQVEKPGNLGAILRSADAAGADAVVVCDERADLFNPNAVRSSVGTIFTNRLIATTPQELAHYCKQRQIQILATFLRDDTRDLFACQMKAGTALIFGTEATGLSDFWLNEATHTLKIPMLGKVDSLNVSNAVAVCLYEAVRQRRSC
ncbi:RNA methyltransferase [Ornithobacterium rhinotracheale]|uniref:TrmH family RNA methyltransferase n=1 Tax=Ornithobacterium rhinotracheale TaxID=28251 RepID=UPI00129CDB45|nr:TrmH family RNA methyltransferase [Ornithobacterium rhinotracheale]MRJ10443.1 RNA methyltransferase [Ornithobacterium rhinotracheale]